MNSSETDTTDINFGNEFAGIVFFNYNNEVELYVTFSFVYYRSLFLINLLLVLVIFFVNVFGSE